MLVKLGMSAQEFGALPTYEQDFWSAWWDEYVTRQKEEQEKLT